MKTTTGVLYNHNKLLKLGKEDRNHCGYNI